MIKTFSIFDFLFWLIWGYNLDKLSKYFVPKLSLICDCEKKCGHFLAIPSNSFLSKISDPENNREPTEEEEKGVQCTVLVFKTFIPNFILNQSKVVFILNIVSKLSNISVLPSLTSQSNRNQN